MLADVRVRFTAAPKPNKGERRPGSIATGGRGVSAQCVALMSTLLGFAVARGFRPDNPASGVKKPPIRKMERFLSEAEIARLAIELDAEANRTGNPFPAAAIKLLLLTGARRREITGLQWQRVESSANACGCQIARPARRSSISTHRRWKSSQTCRACRPTRCLPGKREGRPLVGIDKVWFRVRTAAGLKDVRLHDLRHSFASMGVAGGLSLPIIGAFLVTNTQPRLDAMPTCPQIRFGRPTIWSA